METRNIQNQRSAKGISLQIGDAVDAFEVNQKRNKWHLGIAE